MDTVIPPEAVAGAVCACCLQRGSQKHPLQCCSACQRAWYCNAECQAKDWRSSHKAACKAAKTALTELNALIATSPTPTCYEDAQKPMTSICHAVLAAAAIGGVPKDVFNMVHSTVFCRVCFRTRQQVPADQRRNFKCCPDCLWGWCCSEEHFQQHKQQHARHCATYAAMSSGRLLNHKHMRQGEGGAPIQFCPMGKVRRRQFELPRGWVDFKRARGVPPFNEDAWMCITEGLSIPLTAVLACSHLYSSQDLSRMTEFTLHLVGSADYESTEVMRTHTVEEVMHLLPAVKKLHVVMVGPELVRILSSSVHCQPMEKGTCPECTTAGCSRKYSFFRGPYEDYAASPHWSPPTLALACNSGIGSTDNAGWDRALAVMMDKDVPACFTSFSEGESKDDSEALTAAGARIVHGPTPNRFKSLLPFLDSDVGPDQFYYHNAYYTCIKGSSRGSSGGK